MKRRSCSPSCKFDILLLCLFRISCEMRRYQIQGLDWMVSLHHNGLNGMLADGMVRIFPLLYLILADIFSFRASVKPSKRSPSPTSAPPRHRQPHLIVVPKSTPKTGHASLNNRLQTRTSSSMRHIALRTSIPDHPLLHLPWTLVDHRNLVAE